MVHADVGGEHRSIGKVPRQLVRVSESVGVDFTKRLRVAIGSEFVDRWNGVVSEPLCAARHRRAARIDSQNRADERIEPLQLPGVSRVRSRTVAEADVAAARVDQAIVAITRRGARVELEMAERMRRAVDHMGDPQQLTPGALERVGGGIRRVPLGDDVVVGHVRRRESWRDEVRGDVARRALHVHGVQQTALRKLRVEGESREPAGECGVGAIREDSGDDSHTSSAGCFGRARTAARASR